jgi:hypothetical protein
MEELGGFRGDGHLWAGMGDSWLRDAPAFFHCRDASYRFRTESQKDNDKVSWVSTVNQKSRES